MEGEVKGENHPYGRQTSKSDLFHNPNWGPGPQARHAACHTSQVFMISPGVVLCRGVVVGIFKAFQRVFIVTSWGQFIPPVRCSKGCHCFTLAVVGVCSAH